MMHYVLRGKEVVPIKDVIEWARSFERSKRIIQQDDLKYVQVSTVFLGLDYNWSDEGPPLVFESMVFPGEREVQRYATWDEAYDGHQELVKKWSKRSTNIKYWFYKKWRLMKYGF